MRKDWVNQNLPYVYYIKDNKIWYLDDDAQTGESTEKLFEFIETSASELLKKSYNNHDPVDLIIRKKLLTYLIFEGLDI